MKFFRNLNLYSKFKILVFLDFLKFKEFFYNFKDIPRRFLPCSYFKFILIDQ